MLSKAQLVKPTMNPRSVIAKNSPWSHEYSETSFTGILHENGVWQREEYWLLEWALYDLTLKQKGLDSLYGPVFSIFTCAMSAITSTLDQNDLYEIKNLTDDEVYEFRERIKLVFEGFFTRRFPERAMFDEVNPLLP